MNFSKRIKKIASLVDSGAHVIDIGCDHGLLDIYLTLYNNNKCIASDINKNAIQNAINNIKKQNLNIPTVLSNGIDKIDIKNISTCVIAGMGTSTIKEILNTDKIKLIDTFIIQTNNDYYSLRKTLINKGYYIEDEISFIDKKIWYVIIKFKKGYKKYSKIDLYIGPMLKNKQDDESIKYKKYLYNKYNDILLKIPNKYIIKKLKIKYLINKLKQKM